MGGERGSRINTASPKPSISAVLPAYNEEGNIESAVAALASALARHASDYQIIVVDDGSADRTGEIADALAQDDKRITVIHHCPNKGYGAALATGFARATGELIFYTDSDNQFDVSEIDRLLARIGRNDIVVGYRRDRRDSRKRRFFAWCYKQFIAVAFGLRMRDVDCAFKLFRSSLFDYAQIESRRFFVDAEMMAKAKALGLRVEEVPVTHLPRGAGKSTVRLSEVFSTLKEAARVWRGLYCANRKY